ncbi:MAG: 16S rRNA (adenine(1518)-N(6)/adenine(1519)-N(6))-dimethyltransferase RsmA [candidate division WOR-3 bacterium]
MLVPLKPKKKLSQYFLTSEPIAKTLVSRLDLNPSDEVLEIGAGTGMLTKYLCQKAKLVYAVEIDPQLTAILKENTNEFNNLVIINMDILKLNWQCYQGLKIIGNLPYHLASKILFLLIVNRNSWQKAVLTLDENVAQKILKKPNEPQGSILAALYNLYTERKKILKIPPEKFYPSPNVNSVSVLITKRPYPLFSDIDQSLLGKVLRIIFRHPRKTVANNLNLCLKLPKNLIFSFSSSYLTRRAEELTLADFYQLAKHIASIIQL